MIVPQVSVGMVDGILTKPRNQINNDSLLIDRLSTSINHPLSLSLDMPSRSKHSCKILATATLRWVPLLQTKAAFAIRFSLVSGFAAVCWTMSRT
jgi:hypothetical protein